MHTKPKLLVAGHLVALVAGLALGMIVASLYVVVSAAYHGEIESLVKNEFAPGGLDLALSTVVQNGLFVALVLALAALLPVEPPWQLTIPGRTLALTRIRHGLAWRGTQTPFWLAGLAGGLTIGLAAQFVLSVMQMLNLPDLFGSLDMISGAILDTDGLSFVVVFVALAIVAPIGEELLFRGYLWAVLRKVLSPMWTLVVTTLAFAMFHLEPVHVIGLLPTAVYLGWLRMRTGSVKLCIFVHAINNAMAVLLGRFLSAEPLLTEADPDLIGQAGLGAVGLAVTIGTAVVAMRAVARMEASSATSEVAP